MVNEQDNGLEMLTNILQPQQNDQTFSSLWKELKWRDLVHVSTDEKELEEKLGNEHITFYCGFDPTAPSLHLGNLVQLLTMRRLQLAGHTPLALVGGSTGLIGDPRPTAERTLNSKETVEQWVSKLRAQIQNFLDFDEENQDNAAFIVNNLDWTQPLNVIDFLRDIGKYFRVGSMLKKDAVSARLNSESGISYTEFSYQVLQGMDYLELFRKYNCTLQTGGSDQWGNLVSGVELIHKAEEKQVQAFGTPLITNSDGTKFGKSEGNAIWLDATMVSPYAMYQFWLNTTDEDVVDRLKVFTFLDKATIKEIQRQADQNPQARLAQKILAFQVTGLVHGSEVVHKAIEASKALFSNVDLSDVDKQTLQTVTDQLPHHAIESYKLEEGSVLIYNLLQQTGLVKTSSEGRRTIKEGGVYVNNKKVHDEKAVLTLDDIVAKNLVILRRGKKNLAVVEIK